MIVPEIKFYTSPVYERVWWNFRLTKPPKIDPETFDRMVSEIRSRKNLFHEYLKDMTHLLGIEWHRKEIEVTMVSLNIGCFSRPLTISLSNRNSHPRDTEDSVDDLTHELIHNALVEHPQYKDALEKLAKDFPKEPFLMHVHVLVHAVHALIYEQKRGTHRMNRDIEQCQKNEPYKKAWKVVQEKGSSAILKKYMGVKTE